MQHIALAILITTISLPISAANVQDLAWMSGSWRAAPGERVLEEHWSPPRGGTLGAFVKMVNPAGTTMVEMIVISEVGDTLVLTLQQWGGGLGGETAGPEHLRLASLGERTVTFEGDGKLQRLTYGRPQEAQFTVHVELDGGESLDFALSPDAR